jgi:hypothetical protein
VSPSDAEVAQVMQSDAEVTQSDEEVTQVGLQINGLRGLLRLSSLAFLRDPKRSSGGRRKGVELSAGRRFHAGTKRPAGRRCYPGTGRGLS